MSSRKTTGAKLALAALSLCITALSVTTPAHAYVRESSNWNPSRLPVNYYINQGTIPSSLGTSAGIGAVEGGFASWAAPTCTSWRTNDLGNTSSSASTRDSTNVIMWLTAWPAEYGSSTIGVTTPVWTTGGYFIDADIVFNAYNFRWNTTGTGGGSYVDAQSIATHEEGHFLGLDHSPSTSAVMYASYSGGLKRTLTSDDQNGVCAIYPSGVAPTDSGVAPVDAGTTSSDPCARFGPTCMGCTRYAGCGFCGASGQCVSGTISGPSGGSCASDYAWYQTDCTTTTPTDAGTSTGTDAGSTSGGGRFGDPCSTPTDCASGGICAVSTGTGTGFCTQACADDCTCPAAYQCYDAGSVSICIPGGHNCATGNDAGTVLPGDDAAVLPGDDGGVVAADDAGPRGTHAGGCGCSTAGATHGGLASTALLLAALGMVGARRRRRG